MASHPTVRKTFEIKNRLGLHARAAVQLVQVANQFDAEVRVSKDGRDVNGKSVIEIMMLAAGKGSTIDVAAEGPQADALVDAIGALIEQRFHEKE